MTSTTTYAWGNVLGWVNFDSTNGNVTVTSAGMTGYAWSANYGWINLSPTNGGVINDGQGNLSGKAWGANTGWIDFAGVSITSSGQFAGQTVSSSLAGVINFSCANCLVTTSWRPAGQTVSSSTTSTPSGSNSNSSGGSYVGAYSSGGFSPIPYAMTSSTPAHVIPNASVLSPKNGASQHQPAPTMPNSQGGVFKGVSPLASSSSYSAVRPLLTGISTSTSSKSIVGKLQDALGKAISNASTEAKLIGGTSILLIVILILWRLII
ncbi:MAG: hypothetical protein P4L61_02195 [Candidatus Pacebacteria bacterium]|nr:hypothetical protein [Candidatus Paceibacterota bacterium]